MSQKAVGFTNSGPPYASAGIEAGENFRWMIPWRPDRCGILITLVDQGIPSHFEKRVGIKFHLVGSLQSVLWEPCVHYIASLIDDGIPVFLSVPGGEGHDNKVAFLNDGMAAAVGTHIDGLVAQELQHVLDSCKTARSATQRDAH
jgi:hypothetical protein